MTPFLPVGILPVDLDWAAVDAMAQRFTLGVPEIDSEHRMLFAWYVALRKTPSVQQVADGLVAYAVRHFTNEEAWAADRNLDIAVHHDLHNQLLARLDELLQTANRMSAMALVYDWLTTHIDVEDRTLVTEALHGG